MPNPMDLNRLTEEVSATVAGYDWSDVHLSADDVYDSNTSLLKLNTGINYIALMSVFKYLMRIGEKSERALALTGAIVKRAHSNYPVWAHRRDLLTHLEANLLEERDFLDGLMLDDTKCYQMWNHRQHVVALLLARGDKSARGEELAFIETILMDDAKNFHAWDHRSWLVNNTPRRDEDTQRELDFAETLIRKDPYNNSAWSYRLSITTRKSFAYDELPLLKEFLPPSPDCLSMWDHLIAIVQCASKDTADTTTTEVLAEALKGWLGELIEKECGVKCIHDVPPVQAPNEYALSLCFCLLKLQGRVECTPDRDQCVKAALSLSSSPSLMSGYWKFVYEQNKHV